MCQVCVRNRENNRTWPLPWRTSWDTRETDGVYKNDYPNAIRITIEVCTGYYESTGDGVPMLMERLGK